MAVLLFIKMLLRFYSTFFFITNTTPLYVHDNPYLYLALIAIC